MTLEIDRIDSPLGPITLVAEDGVLCTLDFADCDDRMHKLLARRFGDVRIAPAKNPGGLSARLDAYFAGDLDALEDIDVKGRGTPFQERVWRSLRKVAAGQTISYGALAGRIGRPGAARAVGSANRLNPIALVIPCHRVIGAGGALTGYAGGMHRKHWLLRHEGALDPELEWQPATRAAPTGRQ